MYQGTPSKIGHRYQGVCGVVSPRQDVASVKATPNIKPALAIFCAAFGLFVARLVF